MAKTPLIIGGLAIAGIFIYLMTRIKKITKIISTNFKRIDNTIRNTVAWSAGITHNFVLVTIYGIDHTGVLEGFEAIHWSPYVYVTTGAADILTDIDMVIPAEPRKTYDAITILGDADNPNFPYGGEGVYQYKINKGVLIIS